MTTNESTPAFRLVDVMFHDEPMRRVWSERSTVQVWLDVEAALARSQGEVGMIEPAHATAIAAACRADNIDLPALWHNAKVVGYPIMPLVRQVAAQLPDGPSGRVHYGATTQDIMDSALALQLGRSCDRLIDLVERLGDALASLTEQYADQVMAARTHAQQAVPTTFGAKTATFLSAVERGLAELRDVSAAVRVVSLHGAGGTSAAMGEQAPAVRAGVARRLGLRDTAVPWHVARDEVARFASLCARLAATCVRFAREIVDLSRTELAEVSEQTGHHRGASSTMPQKANPISSEYIVGVGVAAQASAGLLLRAMEAGHERSAGEWQIEWIAVPDTAERTAVALALCVDTAETLQVYPEAMARNLAADGGLLMSEALSMRLAEVLGHTAAHDVVYTAAVRARKSGRSLADECLGQLDEGVRVALGPLDLSPGSYVGQAPAVAAAAVASWRGRRQVSGATASSDGAAPSDGQRLPTGSRAASADGAAPVGDGAAPAKLPETLTTGGSA